MFYICLAAILCTVLTDDVSAAVNTTVAGVTVGMDSTSAGKVEGAVLTTQQLSPAVTFAAKSHNTTDGRSHEDMHVGSYEQLQSEFIGEANSSIILQCRLEGDAIQWFKDDKNITPEEKLLYTLIPFNNSLQVNKIGPDCYGDFRCSNGSHNESITLWVTPYVAQPEKKFKNVIEGDPFVVECKAWGHPAVIVTWTHNKQPVVIDGRIIFKEGSLNTSLRIHHTEYEDAGTFECVAENKFGNASMVMEMNVKDKLAALWPFLGICAEVAILCIIIVIFEKRRSKRLKAEESRMEETHHLNAGNESKASEELRHRKQ